MQLRRVTTSIYLVFIAHWRGEIPRSECETAVNSTLEVLCVIGTRWQSAAKVGQVVVQLADKSGASCCVSTLQGLMSRSVVQKAHRRGLVSRTTRYAYLQTLSCPTTAADPQETIWRIWPR